MDHTDYLCILLVEGDNRAAQDLQTLLAGSRFIKFIVTHVSSIEAARRELDTDTFDAVLLGARVGDRTGFDLVGTLDFTDLFLPPIIMISDSDDRRIDLQAQDAGLDDFLVRRDLNPELLERAIRYALSRKDHARRLQWLAFYDQLTELPNRAQFYGEMERRLETASRTGESFAVILMDMDRFMDVIDSLGHSMGDELLQMVAQRLLQCMGDGDFVARLGGDEFVAVLRGGLSREQVEATVRAICASLSEIYRLQAHDITTSVSLGVSIYPDHGTSYSALLKCADLALVEAKAAGRAVWRLHAPETQTV